MSGTPGTGRKAPLPGAFFHARGFSLLELVAVLVILGVLGAMAVPRLAENPLAERGYAEQVAEALRYSHTVAVASGCAVRFTIDAAGFAVTQDNPSNVPFPGHCGSANTWLTPVARADGAALAGAPPDGVVVGGAIQVVFNPQGFVALAPAPIVIGAQTVTVQPSGLVVGP